GTGGAAYPLQLGGVLAEWVSAPDLEPYRKIDGRDIVRSAIGTLERYTPTPTAREDYIESYAGERFADSMRYVRAYPAELPVLRALLPEIRTPVQVLNGSRDTVVPPANAESLRQHLPQCRVDLIDANHFIWEDAAEEYADLVLDWWDGGFRNATGQRVLRE